jgi:hypothetical protein
MAVGKALPRAVHRAKALLYAYGKGAGVDRRLKTLIKLRFENKCSGQRPRYPEHLFNSYRCACQFSRHSTHAECYHVPNH